MTIVRRRGGDGTGGQGPAGPRGKSAYEVAVEEGFVGTVDDWLASLVGPKGDPGEGGGGGGGGGWIIPFSRPGLLSPGVGSLPFIAPTALTIVRFRIGVGQAPAGADVIVDVNRNGSTIFTTQANRPRVPAGALDGAAAVPNVTALNAGDRLTFDVDQVGSTFQGADLGVAAYALAPGEA